MSHEDEYLSVEELIEIQKEETREIIQALREDGSDPDALYEIEPVSYTHLTLPTISCV